MGLWQIPDLLILTGSDWADAVPIRVKATSNSKRFFIGLGQPRRLEWIYYFYKFERFQMIRRIAYLLGYTVLTFVALFYFLRYQEYKAQSIVPVNLPSFQLLADDNFWHKWGYVTAKGTWIFESGDKANPLSTSEIGCIKSEKVCRDATAIVSNFGFSGSPFLNVDKTTFNILKWDDTQIIYTDTQPTCVYYLYTINRITKEVSGVRKTKTNADPNACESVEKKDFHLRLVSGSKVYQAELEKVTSMPLIWSILIGSLIFWLGGLYLIWKRTK